MQSTATTPTREQRIVYKRLQILAEMNESIHTLTKIEAVLDQICESIISKKDSSSSVVNSNKRSGTGTELSLQDKMNQLLIELQKWDDDF